MGDQEGMGDVGVLRRVRDEPPEEAVNVGENRRTVQDVAVLARRVELLTSEDVPAFAA